MSRLAIVMHCHAQSILCLIYAEVGFRKVSESCVWKAL